MKKMKSVGMPLSVLEQYGNKKIFRPNVTSKTYYIDEENRVVVCKLKAEVPEWIYRMFDAIDMINLYSDHGLGTITKEISQQFKELHDKFNSKCDGEMKFAGKAVCSSEDKFDERIGKQLATRKAIAQLYRTIKNSYKLISIIAEKYLATSDYMYTVYTDKAYDADCRIFPQE